MLDLIKRTFQRRRTDGLKGRGSYGEGIHVYLPADALVTIERCVFSDITCCQGTAWITQEGDHEDHILNSSDYFIPRGRSKVVLWAMSDTLVLIRTSYVGRAAFSGKHGRLTIQAPSDCSSPLPQAFHCP